MSLKIGRNDPCWCGSGKKYKKCHEAFDEKMEIMKQKGYAVIDHDLIKNTRTDRENKKKAAKSISQFLIMWKSILNQVYPLKRLTDGYMKRLYGMGESRHR